jgi:RHS repeat-associated protein
VVERFEYDPYGKAKVRSAAADLSDTVSGDWSDDAANGGDGLSDWGWVHLHQGGRYDATAGLYEFGVRFFSPTLARWMQADHVGQYVDGMNLYQYVSSNPAVTLDPAGMEGVRATMDAHQIFDYGAPPVTIQWPGPTKESVVDPDCGCPEDPAAREERIRRTLQSMRIRSILRQGLGDAEARRQLREEGYDPGQTRSATSQAYDTIAREIVVMHPVGRCGLTIIDVGLALAFEEETLGLEDIHVGFGRRRPRAPTAAAMPVPVRRRATGAQTGGIGTSTFSNKWPGTPGAEPDQPEFGSMVTDHGRR